MNSNPPTPMRLIDWIKEAGNMPMGAFVESAVDLALALTKRIIQISAQDIRADNIIIYVSYSLGNQLCPHVTSADVLSSHLSQNQNTGNDHRMACHALGKVFLLLFSRGVSQSTMLIGSGQTRGPQFRNISLGANQLNSTCDDDGVIKSPDGKRMFGSKKLASRSSHETSISASLFLRDQGLPISVCRLVSDLLDAETHEFRSNSAILSLEEVQVELSQMKNQKKQFLFDRTCPSTALEDTGLFRSNNDSAIFGRESELEILTNAVEQVSNQPDVRSQHAINGSNIIFPKRAVFVSGRSGSGKSTLLRQTMNQCRDKGWFVVYCKFDKQADALTTMFKALDTSLACLTANFTSYSPLVNIIYRSLMSSIDMAGIRELCEILPNLEFIFPDIATPGGRSSRLSPSGEIGSRRNRLDYLFHVLMKSLCSTVRLVFALDDMQWADLLSITVVATFFGTMDQISLGSNIGLDGGNGGILLLGSYRDNEVDNDGFLMNQMKYLSQCMQVTFVSIGELSKESTNIMLSSMLYLPTRLTSSLATIVHQKTCGNAMFVIEFLKSIITNHILQFSVKSRRWVWDDDVIDLISISKGVAELLSEKLTMLPSSLIEVLKVASAFGSQVEVSTLKLLNKDPLAFRLQLGHSLPLAVQEGFMEKAGPVYAFSHDSLQAAVYDLIPVSERKFFHKKIGTNLMMRWNSLDSNHIILAADQMNLCKDEFEISSEERVNIAGLQLLAGKHSMKSSCFESARSYIESGISLLQENHWESNYSLSLELYEMSALVSFIDGNGNADATLKRLQSILQHARTFEDTLNASVLLSKFMGSRGNYAEAINNCLGILSNLGETFPNEIDSTIVSSSVAETKQLLANITKEQISQYPVLNDPSKLNAMKFMSLLMLYAVAHKPSLMPIVSNRMMKLSFNFGFCDDSLLGLAMAAYGIVNFGNDIMAGYRVGKVAESLIEESQSKQTLRNRLVTVWYGHSRMFVEPIQASREKFIELYNQSMLSGDLENAMYSRLFYCNIGLHIGSNLDSVGRAHSIMIEQMTKLKQNLLNNAMSSFRACTMLLRPGAYENASKIKGIKTFDELRQIAYDAHNEHLLWHVDIDEMLVKFWFREYIPVTRISERYRSSKSKRSFELLRRFYDGIASFAFARDTNVASWTQIGEESVAYWMHLISYSKWNFENKLLLLQAEQSYTNGEYTEAERFYEASILSARQHRFMHEEALANELYGMFLCDRGMADKAWEQLNKAHQKYMEWGALGKAAHLNNFMRWVDQKHVQKVGIIKGGD